MQNLLRRDIHEQSEPDDAVGRRLGLQLADALALFARPSDGDADHGKGVSGGDDAGGKMFGER